MDVGAEKVSFQTNTVWAFLANLGLVHALGLFPDVTWNGPSWSISVEFYTYLVFSILMVTARSQASFALLLGALPIIALGILVTRPEGHFLSVETDYGFFRCVLAFGLGVAVQCCVSQGSSQASRSGTWLQALLAVGILALIWMAPYKSAWCLLAPPLFRNIYLGSRQVPWRPA